MRAARVNEGLGTISDGESRGVRPSDLLAEHFYDVIEILSAIWQKTAGITESGAVILNYYADLTFHDGVLSDDVIPLCAAFTAQDTGDARMALDLLETAGNIAHHEESNTATEEHVRLARSEVDRANTQSIIRECLTVQMQLTLMATTLLVIDPEADAKVKHIYSRSKTIYEKLETDVLSESRIRDHINTLEMFGLFEAEERNLGRRGGRTFIYSLVDEPRVLIEIFLEDERLMDSIPSSASQMLRQFEQSEKGQLQSSRSSEFN